MIVEEDGARAVRDQPMEAVHPELAGRAAVVTGAAGGIGRAFAAALAVRGVDVVVADLDDDRTRRAADALSTWVAEIAGAGGPIGAERAGRVVPSVLDVRDQEANRVVADQAVELFGRLDIWINNAGVLPWAPATEISAGLMRDVMATNLDSVLFGAQAAARHLPVGGAIVNMASIASVRVRRGAAAYCSSKAAVEHLTSCLAVELGDRGIRVNALAPGFVDTGMTKNVQEDPERLARALDAVPLHRIGSPEEMAGPLLFLVSDSARYITGHTLAVDGGSRHTS